MLKNETAAQFIVFIVAFTSIYSCKSFTPPNQGCFCSGKGSDDRGYLILERPNAGIVLSTNARFYAIVKPLYEELKPDSWAWAWTDVKLTSPQMGRETMYKLSLKHLQLQCVSSSDSRNPFVEYALQYAVAAAHATFDNTKKEELQKLLLLGLDITILGCNEFYSYRNQVYTWPAADSRVIGFLPPFTSITFNAEESSEQKSKPEVAKTGLGSSAAMTTAVVAALLHYLGVVKLPLELNSPLQGNQVSKELDVVHIIAQTAHCIAQGKVGSGFDVSSAVYGSQRYIRFSPGLLSSAQDAVQGMSIEEVIGDVLKANWDHERTKFSLPPMMTLVNFLAYLAETSQDIEIPGRVSDNVLTLHLDHHSAIHGLAIAITMTHLQLLGEPGTGGSSTPSMVGAVKKWQKSDLKVRLKHGRSYAARLRQKRSFSAPCCIGALRVETWNEKYLDFLFPLWTEGAVEPNQTEVVKALLGARDAMLVIRCNMRKMGEAAGIPVDAVADSIEPKSQTQLLDTTMNMEGVLLAGVPGAGGFDAVFAVTLGSSNCNVIKVWSSLNVLALLVTEDPRGLYLESNDPRTKEITGAVSSIHI
ncbi:hypothetical protein DH2020_049255 [Rehmannia glutinosa]|uniref:phosphomevalonate kinase n=1 Tax=Rehmannia glutinosa TaxID=99300 RepID=A0ABR0U491_REHGL